MLRATPPLVAGLLFVSGCGGASVSASTAATPSVSVGGVAYAIRSLTDLDTIRDVSASSSHVFAATDHGVLVYDRGSEQGEARRVTEGLPSEDVRAVLALEAAGALVATAGGLVELSGEAVTPMEPPPVGVVSDLARGADGAVWACGEGGIAKQVEQGFVRFGEALPCRFLIAQADAFWAGLGDSLLRIEGDVIREHAAGQGLPEGVPHAVVPLEEGRAFVLSRDGEHSRLGYYDGERWYSYTLDGFTERALTLGKHGGEPVLLLAGRALVLTREDRAGAARLSPLSASATLSVRSYRARLTAPGDVGSVSERPVEEPGPSPFLPPPGGPTIAAPRVYVTPVQTRAVPADLYAAWDVESSLYLADRNRGLVEISDDGGVRELRSHDLVAAMDLQIAVDSAASTTWLITDEGDLGMFDGQHLRRVAPPAGARPQSIATGPHGVTLVSLMEMPEAPTSPEAGDESAESAFSGSRIGVHVWAESAWRPLFERTLMLPQVLIGAPIAAVAEDESVWIALRIAREEEAGARIRGVAVLHPREERVTYHYRGASRESDGMDALQLPDEVSAIDLGQEGFAWFATLSGAARIGEQQAVIFGEARGVRGEVVSDVAVGEDGRVWVAAAEGVGYWEDSRFNFDLPAEVQSARVIALALDNDGSLWGAGVNGAVYHDGQRWLFLDEAQGLPSASLRDVEVDSDNRVWLLSSDRVMVVERN